MPFINLAASARAFGHKNYSIQAVAIGTGGTITYNGGYTIHTFTTTGNTTFTLTQPVNVEYLVVAAGGGGGGSANGAGSGGSGGGGGGVLFGSTIAPSGSFTVTVGTGGSGGAAGSNGTQGGNSSVIGLGLIAVGGGYGGGSYPNAGGTGGCGGGGAYTTGGAGTTGQGMKGGDASSSWGSGGGGQSKAGSNTAGTQTGTGGDGLYSSISGTATWYAGGGGGGNENGSTVTNGGQGGGGSGGIANAAGTNGTANTGGGGGGGGYSARAGGNGGSGIVIIRYLTQLAAVPPIDQYRANVAVHLSMEGSNGGSVFSDSSPVPKAITSNSVTTVTGIKKFNTSSAAFNGSTGSLTIPSHVDFGMGTGDFTFETQLYYVAYGSGGSQVLCEVTTTGGMAIYTNDGGGIRLDAYGVGNQATWSWSPSLTTWYHIAVCRCGTSVNLFVDGTKIGSTQTSSYNFVSGAIGIGGRGASYCFNGNMDELRLTKGIARYINNFAAPTSEFPTIATTIAYDQHADNVVLSLHGDGTTNGTLLIDSSPNKLQVTPGTGVITTPVTGCTGMSAIQTVSGAPFSVTSADFQMGTLDFTYEARIYLTMNAGQYRFFDQATNDPLIYVEAGNSICLLFQNGGYSRASIGTMSMNQWHHLAVTRQGTTVRVFLNGTKIDEGTTAISTGASATLNMGNIPGGYMEEIRVTRGVCRYVSNFTVPSFPYPDTGGFNTWNTAEVISGISLSSGRLGAAIGNTYNTGLHAGLGRTAGKWYWEVYPTTGDNAIVGAGSGSGNWYPGNTSGVGYNYNGQRYPGNYGGLQAWSTGDTIGIGMDLDNKTLDFYRNNVYLAGGTAGNSISSFSGVIYPMTGSLSGPAGGQSNIVNFGQNPLKYTPPNGTFWNPKDAAASFTGTMNNMLATITTSTHNVRANTGKATGKWYFEIKIISGATALHEGLMTAAGSLTAYMDTQATDCKSCLNGGLYGTGAGASGSTHANGDVIGWAFDGDAHTVQIFKNGVANTGGFSGLPAVAYYPAIGSNGGTVSAQLNTGATPWAYPGSVPSGYSAWDSSTYQLLSLPSADVATSSQGAFVYPASKTTLTYTGADQTYTVPTGVNRIRVKVWGAGAASSTGNGSGIGGAGGYVAGEIAVTAGENLTVIVGQGGLYSGAATYGGGGASSTGTAGVRTASGGGRSAIKRGASDLAVAGGGGGTSSNRWNHGGAAGGATGSAGVQDGSATTGAGQGGTQSAVGSNGSGGGGAGSGTSASGSTGGTSSDGTEPGGGGGGGYYGGGAGGTYGSGAADGSGGGGGSSYIGGLIGGAYTTGTTGSATAPNSGDADYAAGIAVGGNTGSSGMNGGNGRVVIY